MNRYHKGIKLKFRLLSGLNDLFELIFIFNKNTSPRYALANRIPNKNLKILDVCSGIGNGLFFLAQKNSKVKITGIDLSSDAIIVAGKKVRRRNIKNVSFYQMDATRIDFRDEEFDTVMISFGLHELTYDLMLKIIKEMYRVLKNKGNFYIVDYEKQDNMLKNIMLSTFLKIFESKHTSEFLHYNWKEILENVGLHDIEIDNYLFSKLISATKDNESI